MHAAQAEALAAMGCHFVQGFNFGHPLPAREFAGQWLQAPALEDEK